MAAAYEPTKLWRQRKPSRPEPGQPLNETEVIALDVETSGRVASLGHRVTEIAVVGRGIDPIDQEIDTLADGDLPTLDDVAAEVADRLENRVVVGHNITFDLEFLVREFERLEDVGLPWLFYIDTLALARDVLGTNSRWTLAAVADCLDLVPDGELHTAGVDAWLALEVFERLADEFVSPTLADLGLQRLIWQGVDQ